MKQLALLLIPIAFACREADEFPAVEVVECSSSIILEDPEYLERGVTYEGESYHIVNQQTAALDSTFYMSTTLLLVPKQDRQHPDGEISVEIELRYPLEEGDYDCNAIRQPQQAKHGEIIFIETFNGVTKRYTSWAPYDKTDSIGAPGGYIKVFEMTEDSWSLEFGGGGNLSKLEDQIDWGRCGTGVLLNVSWSEAKR